MNDPRGDHKDSIQPFDPLSRVGTRKDSQVVSVLYVDDEPALQDPTKINLEKKGTFIVDTATSVKTALKKMETKEYDVIVSDYQMPRIDGIQFLKMLRAANNPIPFIIFTGKGAEDVVVEAYDAGADFYLPKGGNTRAMFADLAHKITQVVTRRRIETALRESEERYRKVVEQSHDAIFITVGTKFIFVNPRVTEISGYSRDEMYQMDFWDILHPDHREFILDISRRRAKGEPVPKTYDARVVTRGGEIRYIEIAVSSLQCKGKDAVLGSVRDITDRKLAEEALRRSEEKYHSIFNTFDDLYYQTDMQGIILSLSPSCKRITGWDASELIGHQVLDLYPFPDQRTQLLSEIFSNGGTVHDYEIILKNKAGKHLTVSVTSHVVPDGQGNPVAIEGVLRDITDRKMVEEALHASEERYRTLTDFLPVSVFESTVDGTVTFANRLTFRTFGIDEADIRAGINVIDYIAPEQRDKARENIANLITGNLRRSNEYLLIRKDKSRFPAMITASAVYDEKTGRPTGFRGVVIDLTDVKNAERALRESEELFRTLFNNANDAIFLHGMNPDGSPGQYVMVNDIACTRLQYSREELLNLSPIDIVSPSHIGNIAAIARTIRLRGHATFDAIHRRKDGTEFPVEISTHLFELHGRQLSLSIARDITERKQMEESVRASEQRLHAIIDGSSIPQFVINRNHEVIYWNKALERYTGVWARDLRGTPNAWKAFYDTKKPVLADLVLDNEIENLPAWQEGKIKGSKKSSGAYETSVFFPRFGESGTWLQINAIVIRDALGEVIGALETLEDITDRKRAEDALQESYLGLERKVRERTAELSDLAVRLQNEITERNRVMEALGASERKYRDLVEQIGDIVFHIDQDGLLTYISPHVLAAMGMDPELLAKIPVLEMVPSAFRDRFAPLIDTTLASRKPLSGFEVQVPDTDTRKTRVYEINAKPSFGGHGEFTGYSGIARDITERRHLQDEVTASLNEKEILLKEIHHRVKNNMQVISSLLSLQAKLVTDPNGRELLRESQNRVMSIALVHEKLYQSKSLARIDFSEYIRKVAENLFQSYGIPKNRIRLVIRAENIFLPINKAIPLGLILNELFSNSLKYAFPDNRSGEISVDFTSTGGQYVLVFRDDGVGLPEGIDLDNTETLGLQLVTSLSGQIQGTVTLERGKGTGFRIEFAMEQV
ncbi:MAG: PAS domain S-box protein [Methanoregula sp.]